MALEIEGKLTKILPETSGQGSQGTWVKQNFIIETREQYPKKVCFVAWGDKVDTVRKLVEGEDLKISFNVESREFNERWYTDLRAWKIEKLGAASKPNLNPPAAKKEYNQVEEKTKLEETFPESEQGDDLPF